MKKRIEKLNIEIGDIFHHIRNYIIFEIKVKNIRDGKYIETDIPLPNEKTNSSSLINITKLINEGRIYTDNEINSVIRTHNMKYNPDYKGIWLSSASQEEIEEYIIQRKYGCMKD